MLNLSPETEALVRAEAIKLGKTEDEVIRAALNDPVRRRLQLPPPPMGPKLSPEEMRRRVDEICEHYRSLPILDDRTPDEILDTFLDVIGKASRRVISSVNFQEAGQVVYSRRSDAGLAQLNSLMAQINIEIVPFDAQLARVAIAAFQRFGKGHHSRARLNFCDCSAYALAATLG
eukprot:gene29857-33686_t